MRDKICLLVSVILSVCIGSCGRSGKEIATIVEERDSLRIVSENQSSRLNDITLLISTINESLDSINANESSLFINGVTESNNMRQTVLNNIDRLSEIITTQKNKINELENRLNNKDDASGGLDANISGLISNYKKQLADKDRQITKLREELSQKNADIANLQYSIGAQTKKIEDLNKKNAAQNEALRRQDAMLNQCCMTIGTKKELEAKGIVKKGKLVAYSALDRSKFAKVDIRKFTEIEFKAKRPRILTSMPEGSYAITTDGDGNYTLRIINPTDFWRVSNYLVIQTN